ncbi:MAG TPA: hypothetical protein VF041_12130 [Gemmatimonadaceae bacterium]
MRAALMVGSIAAMVAASLPLAALHAQNADSSAARASDTTMRAPEGDSASAPGRDTTTRPGVDGRWRRPAWGRSIVPGLRIVNVENDGAFVTLQDGTEWEVYLPDRPSTAIWRRGDFVTVKLRPIAQGRYTYELTDGRTDTDAAVKLRGRVRAGS